METITIHCTGVTGEDVMTLPRPLFTQWMERLEGYGFVVTEVATGEFLFTAGGAAEYRWTDAPEPTTHYDICETCGGRGEVPTGMYAGFARTHMSYAVCGRCDGAGTIEVEVGCESCCDTGIDLSAPVNLASPPPCPACRPLAATA